MKKASFATVVLVAVLAALVGCASPTSSSSGGGSTFVAFKSLDAPATLSVLPGGTGQIKVTFTPATATDKGVTYAVASNAAGITVSSSGVVTVPAGVKNGTKVVVTVTHNATKKIAKITVIAEKPLPASKAAPAVAAAPTPVTKTVAGKAVPTTTKVGKKSIGKAARFSVLSPSDVRKFVAKTTSPTGPSLYYGLQDNFLSTLTSITDQSAGLFTIGLAPLAKLTTYDPTSTAADSGQDVTFSLAQADIDGLPDSLKTSTLPADVNGATTLTPAYVFALKGWQWHTLESGAFFDLGYTYEIYFEFGGNGIYLDYNDDCTSVLSEVAVAATAASPAATMISTSDFTNATTGFELSSGSINVKMDLTYIGDAVNTTFANLSIDAYDDVKASGATASLQAVYDDNGAFTLGYLSNSDAVADNAVTAFEELDAVGAQKYFGAIVFDATTGAPTVTTTVGTAPTTWSDDKYYSYFF